MYVYIYIYISIYSNIIIKEILKVPFTHKQYCRNFQNSRLPNRVYETSDILRSR